MVESGWNVLLLSDKHPFQIRICREDVGFYLRIYIWNLTHGGGSRRPADEYRIQITGIENATGFLTGGVDRVLILGWWEQAGVFAGFDARKHTGPLGSSPSIQIREETLRDAAVHGVAVGDKGNHEVAVAFRPAFFGRYAASLEPLHDLGQSSQALAALDRAIVAPNRPVEDEIAALPEARQAVVREVSRQLRANDFRERILTAYGHACAFCGIQLRLVEAAHIVPAAQVNNDTTPNGIALCSLHHSAYDSGVVTVDPTYRVRVNHDSISELRALGLAGGERRFIAGLRSIIGLPPAVHDRPDAALIAQANRLRGWRV